jgi:hypothetical protein
VVGVELILPNVRAELSKREEVRVTIDTLASARDPEVKNPLVEFASSHDIVVCDVALVPCRAGAIDRDAVYALLMEHLQDVRIVPLWFHPFVIVSLTFSRSQIRLFL